MASCLAAATAAALAASVCRAAYQSRPRVAPSARLATSATAATTHTHGGVMRRARRRGLVVGWWSGPAGRGSGCDAPASACTVRPAVGGDRAHRAASFMIHNHEASLLVTPGGRQGHRHLWRCHAQRRSHARGYGLVAESEAGPSSSCSPTGPGAFWAPRTLVAEPRGRGAPGRGVGLGVGRDVSGSVRFGALVALGADRRVVGEGEPEVGGAVARDDGVAAGDDVGVGDQQLLDAVDPRGGHLADGDQVGEQGREVAAGCP